jgi:hypothetical protein
MLTLLLLLTLLWLDQLTRRCLEAGGRPGSVWPIRPLRAGFGTPFRLDVWFLRF